MFSMMDPPAGLVPSERPVNASLKSPVRILAVGTVENVSVAELLVNQSRLTKKKVLSRPLYTLGMYTGPPTVKPQFLRRAFGSTWVYGWPAFKNSLRR